MPKKTSFIQSDEATAAVDWLRKRPGGFDLSDYINRQVPLLATKRGWKGAKRLQVPREK